MVKYKKGKAFVIIMILVMLCTSGCGNVENENPDTDVSVNHTQSDNSMHDGTVNESITKEIQIDTGEYNAETDAQSFFLWGHVAQSKQGYYFCDARNLQFYDFKSKQVVPVCNRPNCTHNGMTSPDCNAVFSDYYMSYDTGAGLRYYDGYLYMSACDEEGYDCLYRISLDGSTREKYMRLYRSGKTETTTETIEGTIIEGYRRAPKFWIHRDYVYYINEMEKNTAIRRMKMGTDKEELIYRAQGERAALYRMKAYGDYLVFQTGNYSEDMIDVEADVCAYNIKTGELGKIVEGVYNEYHIYGDKLYYTTATEIRSYDMKTKEDIAVITGNSGYYTFCIDDDYIYTFDYNSLVQVYTHDGKEVCRVSDSKMRALYYVNDGKLLAEFPNGKIGIIETTDFADGSAAWSCY